MPREEQQKTALGNSPCRQGFRESSVMSLSDALAEAILSTNSDAIIASNREGIISFWNPGAERVFGFSSGDAVGQSLDIIIPEQLRKRHWDGYRDVMKSGKSRYGHGDLLAVPGIKKDGTRISIEFTIVPLRDGSGGLMGMVAIMRDVTKRFEETRNLKQKLAEATRRSIP
jgi:PAS domain S-box-containing protein